LWPEDLENEVPGPRAVRTMEYPALAPGSPEASESAEVLQTRIRRLEAALEEKEKEFRGRLESERRIAVNQGRKQAGSEQNAWRAECAARLQQTIEAFLAQRDQYFARVEHEVVRLALAIAERILHREAQVDPLLLSGAVRVALGQLAESTEVRLRVPAAQETMWAEMVRLMPGLPLRPQVRADEGLEPCEAILEASLGTVDLGVWAQLGEIERAFFEGVEGPATAVPGSAQGKRE
jgi:flagellar assembly protein FliH